MANCGLCSGMGWMVIRISRDGYRWRADCQGQHTGAIQCVCDKGRRLAADMAERNKGEWTVFDDDKRLSYRRFALASCGDPAVERWRDRNGTDNRESTEREAVGAVHHDRPAANGQPVVVEPNAGGDGAEAAGGDEPCSEEDYEFAPAQEQEDVGGLPDAERATITPAEWQAMLKANEEGVNDDDIPF